MRTKKKATTQKRTRGPAKHRDPDKPRRPKSAYNIFGKEKYKAYQDEVGDKPATAVISLIGKRGSALSKAQRRPYERKAAVEFGEYTKKKAVYMAKLKERRKAERKENNKTKPKRPMSAYLFFGNDKRAGIKKKLGGEAKMSVVMQEIARQWRAAGSRARIKYTRQAAVAKAKYDADVAKWKVNIQLQKLNIVPKESKKKSTTKASKKKSTTKVSSKKKSTAKFPMVPG